MNLRSLALSTLLGLGLTACSGDDSSTSETTNTTQTTQTTQTTNPSTTSTSSETGSTTDASGTDSDGMTTSGTTGDPTTGTTADPTTGTTADPTTGTTADPTTGTTGGGGDPWDPEGCEMPNMPLGVMGIEGTFCSAPCKAASDCPAGPMGTNPQCALSTMGGMDPTNCALVCNLMDDQCPDGATCKDIMQMGLGICSYP